MRIIVFPARMLKMFLINIILAFKQHLLLPFEWHVQLKLKIQRQNHTISYIIKILIKKIPNLLLFLALIIV